MSNTRIAQLRTPAQFAQHIQSLGIALDFDAELLSAPSSPLAQPCQLSTRRAPLANRFCVLPMEGWDATTDGKPTELVTRRWQRFGQSGAKLIWGGEAVAVRPDGRANPRQLVINEPNRPDLGRLRESLIRAHAARWNTDDLFIGLQLTHSGRFCRPTDNQRLEPRILYAHPLLNRKFGLPDNYPVMTDSEIEQLVADYVKAAVLAQEAGFQFVDIKHCHGYLGHEFLSAVDRPGKYGGSFANRTRFLREIVSGIRSEAPGLEIGVRLSAFDFIPFHPARDPAAEDGGQAVREDKHSALSPVSAPGLPSSSAVKGVGVPDQWPSASGYPYAFGGDGTGTGIDLAEPDQFLDLLEDLSIRLVNITAGSPYYNPHIQRPALFPPSDGYQPPEDPLVGVARQVGVTAELKAQHPNLVMVGSGYSYLQEWLPNVAQNVIRTRKADFVGLGRMMLTYPELCADVLEGKPLQRKRICRTFSDCTTAPRKGLVSGCYPLDEFYKQRPEAKRLKRLQPDSGKKSSAFN
jgi:2,4-dienoyl-CoA reductase-like NADH-dependent reductase (Old Yellow Enzyme family)